MQPETPQHPWSPTEEKNDTLQIETAHPPAAPDVDDQLDAIKEGRDVQLKSTLDNLGVWETVKVYRTALIICGLAGFAAATDGSYPSDQYEFSQTDPRLPKPAFGQYHRQQGLHRPVQTRRGKGAEQTTRVGVWWDL